MDVNWRWHGRFQGLLPLSPHALADDGRMIFARPDELEARKYLVLEVDGAAGVREAGSLTVEVVRQMQLTADSPVRIGVTDDDLYLFCEGRKTRFLPERRVAYLSVALARGGRFFAAAFTDMLFAGQTLALADTSGRVVWTKDMDAPIAVVGIAPDGGTVVAGLENGRLAAFDAGRTLLWEAALEEPAAALAVSGAPPAQPAGGPGARCVVATLSGTVLVLEGDDVVCRAEQVAPETIVPGSALALACDARGALVAVAGGDESGGEVLLLDGDGRLAWEHETSARVTGVALSPSGTLLALSQSDGELLLFELESASKASGEWRPAADDELQRALALRDEGKTTEARQALLRALEVQPGHLSACEALIALDEAARALALGEADRLVDEARFAEALQALETARAAAPADADLPRRWAAVLEAAEMNTAGEAAHAEARGDPEGAIRRWRSLLQLDPKRLRAREEVARLSRLAADRLVQEGEAALAAGREEEAVAAWRRAQALAPSESLASRLQEAEIRRCVSAGIALYRQQRFPEAAFQLRKALALQPDHPEALRYLAYISGAGPQSPLSERFSRLE